MSMIAKSRKLIHCFTGWNQNLALCLLCTQAFFGGKLEDGLVKAMENLLNKTDDCELAAIDAIAAPAHSLIIAIGVVRGKLQIEEAIELIRLEEDLQVLT